MSSLGNKYFSCTCTSRAEAEVQFFNYTITVSTIAFICLRKMVLGVWHGYYIQKRRRRKCLLTCMRPLGVFINKTCKHHIQILSLVHQVPLGMTIAWGEVGDTRFNEVFVFPDHDSCDARSIKHKVTIFV